MSFDEIFDLTAGVYFNFYSIPQLPPMQFHQFSVSTTFHTLPHTFVLSRHFDTVQVHCFDQVLAAAVSIIPVLIETLSCLADI